MGTIAVTTLVAWCTLLAVHTHDPSPCLPRFPPFSVRPRLSLSFSLDSFCTYVRFLPVQIPVQRSRARIHARGRVRALSPLFFFSASSLASRRRVPHVLSLLLLSSASLGRPRKHTLRQGDLLGETSSSTQPWTRFLYASLLRSPSVSLVVVRPPYRLPLLLSIVL